MNQTENKNRILAIYPNCTGFGFVLLEEARLIDWGIPHFKATERRKLLARIEALMVKYQPDMIVTEHPNKSPHRGVRVRKLLARILKPAIRKRLQRKVVSRAQVCRFFKSFGAKTKYERAVKIAEWFPELQHRLPPKRKPWMSEAAGMAIFDAVGLALTAIHQSASSD